MSAMTFDDARAAIFARVKATMDASAYAATPVEYENRRTVDLSTQTAPFAACEIHFNDGEQTDMGLNPGTRYRGAIWLAVGMKQGEGTASALKILAVLANGFKNVSFGGVTCRAPRPVPGALRNGWYYETIRVPFYFDDRP